MKEHLKSDMKRKIIYMNEKIGEGNLKSSQSIFSNQLELFSKVALNGEFDFDNIDSVCCELAPAPPRELPASSDYPWQFQKMFRIP